MHGSRRTEDIIFDLHVNVLPLRDTTFATIRCARSCANKYLYISISNYGHHSMRAISFSGGKACILSYPVKQGPLLLRTRGGWVHLLQLTSDSYATVPSNIGPLDINSYV